MSSRHLLSFFLWAASGPVVLSFAPAGPTTTAAAAAAPALSFASSSSRLGLFDRLFGGSGGSEARIPSTTGARDEAAIESCRKAIENPRSGDCPLIELEFPALAALNKLGDGSLRSTTEAEDANLAFVGKLVGGISPSLPFVGGFSPGGRVTVVLGSSSTNSFRSRAEAVAKKSGAAAVVSSSSLSSSSPGDQAGGICVFVTPASRADYAAAQKLARSGSLRAVVLVNAFAKDPGSVPGDSTMAYFLKPLTYNSAVAGYLVRSYPGPWTVLDATTGAVLGSFSDEEILVGNTNTPDLRASGRMVQRSVDERAIAARNR